MGDLAGPTAPAPAGDLAHLAADERARVASTAADARAPATRKTYAAQWALFDNLVRGAGDLRP